MQREDTSGNGRIATLMETVAELSRAEGAVDVLKTFRDGMSRLDGPRGYISLSTRELEPGHYRITRVISPEGEEAAGSCDPWAASKDIPVHTGGLLGELIADGQPKLFRDLRLDDDPVLGDTFAQYRSLMVVPIFDRGEPLNWTIVIRRDPDAFTVRELEEMILRANLVGGTISKVVAMQQLERAQQRIDLEIKQIARIQRTLLPERMPNIHGVQVAASYATHGAAGGDYYDFLPLLWNGNGSTPAPDGPWGLFIADASGHGPAAAVVMAMMHAILHAYHHLPNVPSKVLEHLNDHLCAKRIESSFVTAFFAVYNPQTQRLRYARAGHNPPLLKTPGDEKPVTRLDDVGGMPLGVMPDAEYDDYEMTLQPGQTLVMYTDGITEAACPNGEMFGVEGMEQALSRCSGEPDCVVKSINDALLAHEDCVQPNDDQTLVAMRIDHRD